MIDKNGKLFGKINIIDLLIIVVIIAALVVFGARRLGGGGSSAGPNQQRVRVTFFGDYVNDFLPDSLTIGDPVSEYNNEVDFGVLTDFSYIPAYEMVINEETGELVERPIIGRVHMTFSCETTGELGPTGLTKDDVTYVVGGNLYMNIGPSRTACQIKSFELLD